VAIEIPNPGQVNPAGNKSATRWHFEPDLSYQLDAINSVTGLFKGQEALKSNFTISTGNSLDFGNFDNIGVGNRMRLDDETLLANLHAVQNSTGLMPEPSLDSMNFTIEMETGTGKTYVYLRTIYELHQNYGFTKFIIVVPSVAIKEGVETSIRQLKDHLGSLYGNPPMEFFQYDSDNLSRIRTFATSDAIQIMIVTVGSINRASDNKLYRESEDLDGETAISLIQATNPIVIVDEPQSVYGDAGGGKKKGKGREALEKFNALATLRYSATHPKGDKANLVYKLDAIKAYDDGLVKQIEVDYLETEAAGTAPYVKVISVRRTPSGQFTGRIEVDTESGPVNARKVTRKIIPIEVGDNLGDLTGIERYRDIDIENIGINGGQWVQFTTIAEPLHAGDAVGDDLTSDERARQMIARTIQRHLDKELEFAKRAHEGAPKIKVLSLFFVDSVGKYREYVDGEPQPGEYAKIFEEEYARIAALRKYELLRTIKTPAEVAAEAHQGYFSIDRSKKGGDVLVDTSETTAPGRQAASLAYEQIMKSKEWLTTPGTPVRFIFSHSALQEGWDNPNVFQICVLRNMGSERWRRQSVGRGLRLAVDGNGDRVHGQSINRLTVIANEDYATFADGLQRELAEDMGLTFGIVTIPALAELRYTEPAEKPADGSEPPAPKAIPLGAATATAIFDALKADGHIDAKGNVQDSLREMVRDDLDALRDLIGEVVPNGAATNMVVDAIRRVARPIDIKKARERREIGLRAEQLETPEFKALWERIKHRTIYSVNVDEDDLVAALTDALVEMAPVPRRKASWVTTKVKLDAMGVSADENAGSQSRAQVDYADANDLPDILSILADRTQLTRQTLAKVLIDSGRLDEFRRNPPKFIDQATAVLNTAKLRLLFEGVKYAPVPSDRPESERWYSQEIFSDDDLAGYVGEGGNIPVDADGEPVHYSKSIYEGLVADSLVERAFAEQLQKQSEVKLFVKLPSKFTVPTPLGTYNPDWAAVIDNNGSEELYFVIETKDKTDKSKLRESERQNFDAAIQHFKAIKAATGYADLIYPNQPVTAVEDVFAHTGIDND